MRACIDRSLIEIKIHHSDCRHAFESAVAIRPENSFLANVGEI
jgi:hypothetical protein